MPCWVAPSIAAEMWRISMTEVMERVNRGELDSKQEGDFTFVNIGRRDDASEPTHPATYAVVSREEEAALLETLDIAKMRLLSAANRRRPMAA